MKRTLLITLSLLLTLSLLIAVSFSVFASGKRAANCSCDVNCDGNVDATDTIVLKRHLLSISKLTGAALTSADVDGSGKVDGTDYIILKKTILGTVDNGSNVNTETLITVTEATEVPCTVPCTEHLEETDPYLPGESSPKATYETLVGLTEVSYTGISEPTETGNDLYPLKYGSYEEIPEEWKKEIKYIADLTDSDHYLSLIIINKYSVNFLFSENGKDSYDIRTGYQVSFTRAGHETVDSIARGLGYIPEEDGTLFDPAYNILYVDLDDCLCSVRYPKSYTEFDKSVINIYETEGMVKAVELYGFAKAPQKTEPTGTTEPIVSEAGYFFNDQVFSSYEEIPYELKKELIYTAELNKKGYRLLGIELYSYDAWYYYVPENEVHTSISDYDPETGYFVKITRANWHSVGWIANHYSGSLDADGTFFHKAERTLYIQLETGFCSVKYPSSLPYFDKSVVTVYKANDMSEVPTPKGIINR